MTKRNYLNADFRLTSMNETSGHPLSKGAAGLLVDTPRDAGVWDVFCFTPGVLIATAQGEKPVETLTVGDRIVTRDNGLQTLRWIGQRDLNAAALGLNRHLAPVLIRAGALGHGVPEADLILSPNHRVLMANDKTQLHFNEREVLVSAKHLLKQDGVEAVQAAGVSYLHLLFDHHEVVLANGAWSESFCPDDRALRGIGNAQRREICELFPELEQGAVSGFDPARRILDDSETPLAV